MAADPGLWLYIYPGGVTFTGTVVYTGGDSSKRYPDETISSEYYTYNQVGGWSALYAGDFGTGEPIRITITVNGRDYIFDETSVNTGDGINIFLDDLPMEDIPRPQETIYFWATDGSQPISIKSLLTNKKYTAAYDDGGFWYANLDLCDTVLVTAPGYKPLVQLVDPCINNDVGQWYEMERYTDDGSIPNKLYGYENLSVTPVGKRWYGWTTVDDSSMYWTIYTETPEGAKAGGVKMYALDNSTGRMLYYDTSDSDSSPRAVGGQRYTRNPAFDIIIYEPKESPILYTTNNPIQAGDTLYNEAGYDTGLKVGTVNSDGSFKLDTVTITFVPYTGPGAWSGSYKGTVNNISFVSATNGYDGCTPNTFVVMKGQPCTITAEKTSGKGDGMALKDSAGNQVAYDNTAFEYTFTPTEDCTFEIGANIEPA